MKKVISLLLVLTVIAAFCGCGKTDAGSDNLYKAYKSVLANGYIYYSVYDIDKNGVSEMILYNEGKTFDKAGYDYTCTVYAVDGKEALCIGEIRTKGELYGSTEAGIWAYSNSYSGEELRHYTLADGVLIDGDSSLRVYNDGDYNYLINENAVSEEEYYGIRNGMFKIDMYDDKCVLEEQKDDAEKVGEVIGYTIYSDIVTKINGCDIPSYNVDGRTVVSTDDLSDFGFDDAWDEETRSINVFRNYDKTEVTAYYEAPYVSPELIGKRAHNVLRTDIMSYLNGQPVTSYNVAGETMICFEDLAAFGAVSYNEAERVLSLEMEWLSNEKYNEYINRRHSIYFESSSEGGYIRAMLNGAELWVKTVYEGEGSLSGTYVSGDRVYYGTHEGFYAADLYTGETIWRIEEDASNIVSFAETGNAVTILCAHSWGARHIAVNAEGELIYNGDYADEDGTGMNVPDTISETAGNVVTLQLTDAAGAGINSWQKVNIYGSK